MARERLFYLQPMERVGGKRKGERYGKLDKARFMTLSSQVVKDCLGEAPYPASAFITLFADPSKRVIAFKISKDTALPLQKNQRMVKFTASKNGLTLRISIGGFLTQVKTKVALPTPRLEVKEYTDDVFGEVRYFAF